MRYGRLVVHGLLILYALILAYVIGGLIFKYNVPVDYFFDLSFALLFFALGQAIYEIGVRKAALHLIEISLALHSRKHALLPCLLRGSECGLC